MSNEKKAYLAIILEFLIIGFSFMFVKIGLEYVGPMEQLALRFLVSFICASIPFIIGREKLSIEKQDFLKFLPVAIFFPLLFFVFQNFGLLYATSSEAGIISATLPIMMVIVAYFILGETTTNLQKLFIIISVVGVIVMSKTGSNNAGKVSILGIGLLLLSTFSNAIYNVLTRKFSNDYTVYEFAFLISLTGFVVFSVISLIQSLSSGTSFIAMFGALKEGRFLFSILFLGILSSFCTVLLNAYGLRYLEASKVGVISNIAAVVALLAGVLILGEPLSINQIIGMIIIFIGVFGTNYSGKK